MEHSTSDNHIQYNPIQPDNLNSIPSSQSFQNANPRAASVKPGLNFSIGTGEEFSLEFMRDRVNPRMPYVPYPAGDPSHTPGYLELKGTVGIRHTGSGNGSGVSMVNIIERGSNASSEFNSTHGSDSSSKIKILCSFGGKILPRPGDGKLRYVGGSTRIIRIRKNIFWQELRQKILEIYIDTYAIKYQLPGEDLDALVSVSCDEDLQNMIEECNVLGIGEGSQKLRLFLFSLSDFDESNFGHGSSGGDNEFQFLVAVNGMDMGSRRESGMHGLMTSSANNLSDLDNQNVASEHVTNLETSVLHKEGTSENVRFSRDDLASPGVLPGEGKLPPKPKMNESRPQDLIHAKAAASNENDSDTSGGVVGPDNSGSDLIDLSYLESPSRVYQSERMPRGQSEKSRLTKSDNTHLQSDVDPISESVGSLHTEDLQPQVTHGGLVNYEKSTEAPTVNNGLVPDTGNDQFPSDFLSDAFARAISEDSHGIGPIGALPQDEASVGYNVSQFPDDVDSRSTFVEGEEKETHGSESTRMQPHYNPSQMENSKDVQLDDLPENLRMPYSEYKTETRNDGLPSIDLSLGDLDISSLQIIRNEDLEELRELGAGTFGTVYHGKWRGTDVAIKRIKKSCFAGGRSSEQERLTVEFWREAVILSKLHHPNVMAFYGVVQDGPDGTLATVTEFMVDGSLRHVLVRKDRHLDHRKRLIIAMDAAFGMEYLHSKNIVHFDLKCDNLLVNMKDSTRPICKVGDFGLSKIKRNTLVSGGVRGTLPWMAPELLNGGSNKVSEKVDVFSFGIVLWEILTREEPYANMHYGAIIGGIVNNTLRPTIPSDCDPDWRRLMEQCWAPDPAVRPSFTEITNQLRVMSAAYQNKPHAHKQS
ncbi:putative protein kinase TKL-Pl-6 family [Helianthus debilis subsp. tardiflorus]